MAIITLLLMKCCGSSPIGVFWVFIGAIHGWPLKLSKRSKLCFPIFSLMAKNTPMHSARMEQTWAENETNLNLYSEFGENVSASRMCQLRECVTFANVSASRMCQLRNCFIIVALISWSLTGSVVASWSLAWHPGSLAGNGVASCITRMSCLFV